MDKVDAWWWSIRMNSIIGSFERLLKTNPKSLLKFYSEIKL